MERAAHLERDAAAGTGFFGQCGGFVHSGFLAADDQLTRAVVVADLHAAQLCRLLTAGGKCLPVKVQHGGHAAVNALCSFGHGFAAVSGQLDGLLCGEHPGSFQRGVFAQRKPGHISGFHALLGQHCGHAAGKGHHAGLGVFGLIQKAVRVLKADAVQIEVQLCTVKCRPERGRAFVKFLPMPGCCAP